MSSYRYILETYKGNSTRYLDTQTGEHISPKVGRCNRESKCGYHYSPKQYFLDTEQTGTSTQHTGYAKPSRTAVQAPSYIPTQAFNASLRSYSNNYFVRYLHTLFDADTVNKLVATYHIGTSKHWAGATVFWQADSEGNIHTGKIMLYNPLTGKRVKEPYNHITWVHKLLNQPDFNLKQCLFGEHLLKDSNKPVAIVESEKTAVIASVYQPKYVWLAVGSLSNLTTEKCSVLKGRKVVLYPDLNGFEKWNEKLQGLRSIGSFSIANVLEEVATNEERERGLDIADFFVQYSLSEFTDVVKGTKTKGQRHTAVATDDFDDTVWPDVALGEEKPTSIRLIKQEDWGKEIAKAEAFFAGIGGIDEPIRLNNHTTILNVQRFIEGNLATVKANNGKRCFKVYLDHLRELREYLERVEWVSK